MKNANSALLRKEELLGDGARMVLESTVANIELNELFWPSLSFGERAQ